MPHDYRLEEQERQYRQSRKHHRMFAAACVAGRGRDTRAGALLKESEREVDRAEAERVGQVVVDEDGHVIDFLDPSLDPPVPNPAQGYAIYLDMCKNEEMQPLPLSALVSLGH